jgi:hypothetical protein
MFLPLLAESLKINNRLSIHSKIFSAKTLVLTILKRKLVIHTTNGRIPTRILAAGLSM